MQDERTSMKLSDDRPLSTQLHGNTLCVISSPRLPSQSLKMETFMTLGMKKACSHEHITIPLLAKLLPKFEIHRHGKSKLVYIIIGHHQDGRWASYPRTTASLGKRHRSHMRNLREVARGTKITMSNGCMKSLANLVGMSSNMWSRVHCSYIAQAS